MPTRPPSVRDRAGLADRTPATPVRPQVVAEELLVPLADIDLADEAFATRVELRLADLVEELARDGQLNAVHLRRRPDRGLQILAGHRRCNAALQLGWASVRAVLHDALDDEEAWRLAWQDNAARRSLSAADRQWTVARLLQSGRNQAVVAAVLGVAQSTVSRDAVWLRLPQPVRAMVGRHGFAMRHALVLAPWTAAHPGREVEPLLRAFRKEPCDATTWRRRALAFYDQPRRRRPTGVRMPAGRLAIDEGKLDPDALGDEGVAALMARLDAVRQRLAEWQVGRVGG